MRKNKVKKEKILEGEGGIVHESKVFCFQNLAIERVRYVGEWGMLGKKSLISRYGEETQSDPR